MALCIRDFYPKSESQLLGLSRTFQPLPDLLREVNAWIDANSIDVVHVETLLLNPVPDYLARGPSAPPIVEGVQIIYQRVQVFRVWYRG